MHKQETFHIHTVSFKSTCFSQKLGHCDLLEVYTWDRLETMPSNKKTCHLYIRNYLKGCETLKYLLTLWWKRNCCYLLITVCLHFLLDITMCCSLYPHLILSAQRYSIHEAFQNHPKRELPNPLLITYTPSPWVTSAITRDIVWYLIVPQLEQELCRTVLITVVSWWDRAIPSKD